MTQHLFPPTRAAGLARLADFTASMGRHYEARRNFDFGPEDRSNTSVLSPYLRRRLLTEREVVAAAIDTHSTQGAEKFIQEVFWRTYFKGWLERRPSVWTAYLEDLDRARESPPSGLAEAEAGTTGIDCFDAWTKELIQTGYLHNHTRMWFASIWIFTLRLPWVLGADFFMRHLLDGDPASNTLSWRWVAGLHTKGKNYAAAPWNIEKFTNGRFAPDAEDLAQNPAPLEEEFDAGPALPVRSLPAYDPAIPAALLVTIDDCHPESLPLSLDEMRGVATYSATYAGAVPSVAAFDRAALEDAASRLATDCAMLMDTEALINWARDTGANQIVTSFLPNGPTRDRLDAARPALAAEGITLAEIQRDWDAAVWPLATAGFFKVKKKIPALLDQLFPT